jgi:hypothetical protein
VKYALRKITPGSFFALRVSARFLPSTNGAPTISKGIVVPLPSEIFVPSN